MNDQHISMLQTLHEYQTKGSFCDTALLTSGGETIMAHSCILAAVSETLYTKLLEGPKDLQIFEVKVDGPIAACQLLLDVIYTGICDPTLLDLHISNVKDIAEQLGINLDAFTELPKWEERMRTRSRDIQPENNLAGGWTLGHDEEQRASPGDQVGGLEDSVVESLFMNCGESVDEADSLNCTKRDIPQSESSDCSYYFQKIEPHSLVAKTCERRSRIKAKRRRRVRQIGTSNPNLTHKEPSENSSKFVCRICNMKCGSKSSLWRHEVSLHQGENRYSCSLCGEGFAKANEYKQHKKASHNLVKKHQCQFCEKTFRARQVLVNHERTHTGDKPFKCDICDKQFTRPDGLNMHMRLHTGETPYKCKVCGLEFRRRDRLVIHEREHVGLKPFKCRYCDKCFQSSYIRRDHEHIHTGEKPFMCNYCGGRYRQRSALRTHEATHTGQKLHQCTVCDKAFMRPTRLAEHMRKHTSDQKSFVCEYCGVSFVTYKGLCHHMRKQHTKENLHKCTTCGKEFVEPGLLRGHMRVHNVEDRPFVCNMCDKSYVKSSQLYKHIASLHKT